MKKILSGLLISAMICILSGCGKTPTLNVNVENNSELYSNTLGKQSFISIGGGLSYDSTTRIVYMVNGINNGYESKTYCPYYAPNGLPYRYNPETNTFEEINNT